MRAIFSPTMLIILKTDLRQNLLNIGEPNAYMYLYNKLAKDTTDNTHIYM